MSSQFLNLIRELFGFYFIVSYVVPPFETLKKNYLKPIKFP